MRTLRIVAASSFMASLAPSLAGCFAAPLEHRASNNPEIQVDLLFTHDGCSVYRFKDGGFHYFVRCDGAPHVTTLTPAKGGDEGIETVTPSQP